MTYPERNYIFDGNSIIRDKYADVERDRYDQTFEDAVEEVEPMNKTRENYDNYNSSQQQNFKSSQESFPKDSTMQKTDYVLIPNELIKEFKEYSYKHRGNLFKPDSLFKYFLEFRLLAKKGQKVPKAVEPLMKYSNDDVKFSLEFYYKLEINLINTQGKSTMGKSIGGTGEQTNQFMKKFTMDTMRRLYPLQKEIEKLEKEKVNAYDVPGFVDRLVRTYQMHSPEKKFSNDEGELFSFWKSKTEEEQTRLGIQWENGEKDLETTLTLFFSVDEIIQRLINRFKKTHGYFCNHARPLHDYWDYQLAPEVKYVNGLFKYKKEAFYKILEKYYNGIVEEQKQQKAKEKEEKTKAERDALKKKKLSQEEYDKLQKKYALLSKAKDRYRTGRVMLKLKNQFKYDNVIRKMINQEFYDNKPFKFPEEYAIYDKSEEQKRLFKNGLDKREVKVFRTIKDTIEGKIAELITAKIDHDQSEQTEERRTLQEKLKQDLALNNFLKRNVIQYYKKMTARLQTGKIDLITKYLNWLYQEMQKSHKEATKRRFPKTYYGTLKKAYKYKKMHTYFPQELKFYFFQLLRRLGKDDKGKFIFAKTDNLSFWSPSLSNECKVHGKNCTIYCTHNSHNDMITEQRDKNFEEIFGKAENAKLQADERVNMWKRPELIKEKEKIFLCFDEARHCTFEPHINYTAKTKSEVENMNPTELGQQRVSNMQWVKNMGEDFGEKFPIVFKEGIVKQAKIAFVEGRFEACKKILGKGFDLDEVKGYFEPKYAEMLKKKRMEQSKQTGTALNDPNIRIKKENEKGKKAIACDDLKKWKNKKACEEVYEMLKEMENYKKRKEKTAKKLQEEIDMIEYNKKMNSTVIIDSKVITVDKRMRDDNPKFAYIKDKYFKYFKTLMCPLKDQCPYDLRPRWPASDIGASIPFGIQCPYAHQVSELKFEQEIKQKIQLRKNLLKELAKDEDPCIEMEWVPTGPIIPCTGCGKTFAERAKKGVGKVGISGGKGLCGFCRYNQKNEIDLKKDMDAAAKSNQRILKAIKYEGKPEEIDQDYMKKFGMLKKSIVLFNFRRFTDSQDIMNKLIGMTSEEQKENEEKYESLDTKWRNKLEIKEKIPREILAYDINQQVLDYFNLKTPLATVLLYSEKMKKGNKFSIYNRHTYLSQQIGQFGTLVKKTLGKYNVDIKHLKKQIMETDLWIAKGEKLHHNPEEIENERVYKNSVRKFKTTMCTNESCKKKDKTPAELKRYNECKDAHTPCQLNKVTADMFKSLMKDTITEIQQKQVKSTALVPWTYAQRGHIEQSPKYSKRSKSAKKITKQELKKLRIEYHEV